MVLKKTTLIRFIRTGFLTLTTVATCSLWGQQEPVKHAIIIANSVYKAETGWRNLGAANDIKIISEALYERGFLKQNMHIFEQQTKTEMQSVLQKYLIDNVSKGDIIYLHFSGHGQQIATLTPSDEPDGLDETLVPIDAPSGNKILKNGLPQPYDYSKHFRDKELKEFLQSSSKKLGENGNIFVVIDACHSGGATRSASQLPPHRGSSNPNVPEGWVAPKYPSMPTFNVHNTSAKGAPIAVFSASGAHELNFEHRISKDSTVGSLSFALAQSLLTVPSNASYQQLFDEVVVHMGRIANRQTPQAEGVLNQEVFGGKMLPFAVYAKVEKIDFYQNDVLINWGQLHEVFEGAEIGFFEPGTLQENLKTSIPLATGKVTESGPLKARVSLNQTADSVLEKAWVYITKKTFGDLSVTVMIEGKKAKQVRFISAFLEKNSQIIVQEKEADFLLKTTDNQLSLFDINNQAVYSAPMPPNKSYKENIPLLLDSIKNKLQSFARAKYITGLNDINKEFRGELQFEVYRKKPAYAKQTVTNLFKTYETTEGNDKSFPQFLEIYFNKREQLIDSITQLITVGVGDVYFLKVKNIGVKEAHFSILAIDPAYTMEQLYPNTNKIVTIKTENKLSRNKVATIDKIFVQQEPIGNQIFKLIVSNDYRDFSPIIYGTDKTDLTDDDELMQMLNEAFSPSSTMTRSLNTTNGMGIYTFIVKVVETDGL
jgi:metacaspase-1